VRRAWPQRPLRFPMRKIHEPGVPTIRPLHAFRHKYLGTPFAAPFRFALGSAFPVGQRFSEISGRRVLDKCACSDLLGSPRTHRARPLALVLADRFAVLAEVSAAQGWVPKIVSARLGFTAKEAPDWQSSA
jgi:hypothetical protein